MTAADAPAEGRAPRADELQFEVLPIRALGEPRADAVEVASGETATDEPAVELTGEPIDEPESADQPATGSAAERDDADDLAADEVQAVDEVAQAPDDVADEPVIELPRPDREQSVDDGASEQESTPEPEVPASLESEPALAAALVDEARELVLEYRRASATFLKRRLRVSDDEAMNLLRALADEGTIECEQGAAQGRVLAER